jgi:hypothetical protein
VNLIVESSTNTTRETTCGTSVNGPLKIVKPHNFESTDTALNHATLAGPGASRASNVHGLPPIAIPSPSVHVKSDLISKSGIEDAIFSTVVACDDFKLEIASTAVALRVVGFVVVGLNNTTEGEKASPNANT